MENLSSLIDPFRTDLDIEEQLDALHCLQEKAEFVSSNALVEFLCEAVPHFMKDSLRHPVKMEVLRVLSKCCSVLRGQTCKIASVYIMPLIEWVCNDNEAEECRVEAGQCIRSLLGDITGPVLDEWATQCLMQFVRTTLRGFPGETIMLTCFDAIRILSLHEATFASTDFWQTVIDALHRLKDSGDLPETVLAEATRSYSQLLFHLQELEVKSPVRFKVRDCFVESPGAGRILSTITNTVEAMRYSASKRKSHRITIGKENSAQELCSPLRPRHRISFELLISPRAPPIAVAPALDCYTIPFSNSLSLPQVTNPWLPNPPAATATVPIVTHEATALSVGPDATPGKERTESSEVTMHECPSPEVIEAEPREQPEDHVSPTNQSNTVAEMDLSPHQSHCIPTTTAEKDTRSEHTANSNNFDSPQEVNPSKRRREELEGEAAGNHWLSPETPVSVDLGEPVESHDSPNARLDFDQCIMEGSAEVGECVPECESDLPESGLGNIEADDKLQRTDETANSEQPQPSNWSAGILTDSTLLKSGDLSLEQSTSTELKDPPDNAQPTVLQLSTEVVSRQSPKHTPLTRPVGSPMLSSSTSSTTTPPPVPLSRVGSTSPSLRVQLSPSFDLTNFNNDTLPDSSRMEMDAEYRTVHAQYVQLEAQFNALKAHHEELQAQYDETVKRNESRKETIAMLARNEDWYQTRIQELEEEAATQQRQYDGLYHSAAEKLATAVRELNDRDAAMKAAQNDVHQLKQKLEESHSQLKSLKEQLNCSEKRLEAVLLQLSQSKEKLQSEEAEAAKAKVLVEERNLALQAAMQQVALTEKALEDTKCQSEARLNTLKAEVALMKAKLAERDAELQVFKDKTMPSQRVEMEKERQTLKAHLLHIITSNGGKLALQDQPLTAYVETIGNMLSQKAQETTELLGYCQKLLDQNESRR